MQDINLIIKILQNPNIAGPFKNRSISNVWCSSIGVIPKKTCGFRLIIHLFENSFKFWCEWYIDERFKYSPYDNEYDLKNMKKDIKSAFKLFRIYPGDFNLFGFTINIFYFIDKCLQMGCLVCCSLYNKFSSFSMVSYINKSQSHNIENYMDDFSEWVIVA